MTTNIHTQASSAPLSARLRQAATSFRQAYLPSAGETARPRLPHPGDVLYWVGCVGAISALLFFSIR